MAAKEASRKFIGRSEQDEPAVLADSGVMPVTGAKVGGYRQGEGSRVTGKQKAKRTRDTGVSKSARRASGRKAVGY